MPTPPPRTPPLFIVFNPGSGASDAVQVRRTIEEGCSAAGREMHLLTVDGTNSLGAIAAEAVRRASGCGGVVVAAGGDGTVNAVAQATLGSACTFGVLPQGTFNYFSRTHGIPTDTAMALQLLLHAGAQDVHDVQVGLVNERVFLVNASLGLYPKLLEDREGWKQQLGRHRWVGFLAALATLLGRYRSLRLQIDWQGRQRKVRTPTLFVGNNALQMEQLGLPLAQAIDAGDLAGIMLRPVSRLAMIALLLRGAFGQLGSAEQLLSLAIQRLTVHAARPFGARRIKVATDGETAWMTLPLVFSVSPQPLRLIRPAGTPPERQAP